MVVGLGVAGGCARPAHDTRVDARDQHPGVCKLIYLASVFGMRYESMGCDGTYSRYMQIAI